MLQRIKIASAALMLSACGASDVTDQPAASASHPLEDTETAASLPEPDQPAELSTNETPGFEDALLKRGRIVWFQCRSCHTLKDGEPHLTGPNLHGLFGRRAGGGDGFVYSDALINSDIVWDESTLDDWLERPDQFIKGNIMAYAGLTRPQDREAIIAYLLAETK